MLKKHHYSTYAFLWFSLQACTIDYYYVYLLTFITTPNLGFQLQNFSPILYKIIIKFPYNARSDWLKQRPLSENKVQVNDIKVIP